MSNPMVRRTIDSPDNPAMTRFLLALIALLVVGAVPPARADTQGAASLAVESASALKARVGRWFAKDWRSGWGDDSTWRLMGSPTTYHYSHSPEHTQVVMLGLERQRDDGLVVGGSLFRNSFGQPSSYLYVGQRFEHLSGIRPLFAHLTGGLLYGYKPPYDNKVPLNVGGFSPGLVGSVGWQFTPGLSGQVNVLGNSALMFQLAAEFH